MLFAVRIPHEENIKHYNRARYLLAFAYMLVGAFSFYKAVVPSVHSLNFNMIRTFTLGVGSYQALLFTFALLVLIQPMYVSIRRTLLQFGVISFAFIVLLILLYNIPEPQYCFFYNIAALIYIFQLMYYVYLFRKKYSECLKKLQDYYNEEEDNRLRWVKVSFYMALTVGIMALLITYLPMYFSRYFVVAIIMFYIYFAIKYSNYLLDFRFIIPAVYADDVVSQKSEYDRQPQDILPLSQKEMQLQRSLDKWVKEKQYKCADMSRDEIAESLGTDRDFLADFFHNRMKTEFRTWRTYLRIEEAKNILLEYPELSISKIGDEVGVSDRSNFQKKFIKLVGMSPKEWRKQNLKK